MNEKVEQHTISKVIAETPVRIHETVKHAIAPEVLLTLQQASERLQVSRSTFWKLRAEYALPVVQVAGITRIRERDFEAWLQKHTASSAS